MSLKTNILVIGSYQRRMACKDLRDQVEFGDNQRDPSFIWLTLKTALMGLAKDREKELKVLEKEKSEILRGFYSSVLKDIQEGIECYEELERVKQEMSEFYCRRIKDKVNKMRELEIDDHLYDDIHKTKKV